MKNQKQEQSSSANGPRVAVASISFGKSAVLRQEMERAFPNAFFNESGCRLAGPELTEFLKDADAAVIGIESMTNQILSRAPQLKIVSKFGVGLDNIDQESLKRRNIALGWTSGTNRRSVSELTLCFMLGLCRNVFNSGFNLKQMGWNKDGGQQLTGKTVGIIGCGHIGSDVVRLLAPFECIVLGRDITDKSDFYGGKGVLETSLEEVIERSDIISLHVPLTELTLHMVDRDFLQRMKSTAFLINTSRGELVNQEALKQALKEGTIAGAALDVFTEEPPSDEEFLTLPNLMVTPHIGGNAKEAVETMGRSAIDHLVSFFQNHPSTNR